VQGIYEEPISAKTPENPPHCHVPLMGLTSKKMPNYILKNACKKVSFSIG
jgi:hypothetical protein